MIDVIDDPVLDALTRAVVERFSPERIVLFGSRARGDHHPHSDYDAEVTQHPAEAFLGRSSQCRARPQEQAASMHYAVARGRGCMKLIPLAGTATIVLMSACRHASSVIEPTPVLTVLPDPTLHVSAVLDEERAARDIGSMRVCVTENWVRVRFGTKDMLLEPKAVSVRLSERRKRQIVFGSEAPAAERTCALLDVQPGEYDLWIAGDGPTPITVRRGYIDSLAATVTIPVGLP